MIQPDLLARIKAAGAAGVTRATLCAELGVTVATVQGKVGKLRALSLIVEQAPAHLNGSRQDCLIWAAEFAPAVVPVIVPPPPPPRNRYDAEVEAIVRAAGTTGVRWQQVAEALGIVETTAQGKLQALVTDGIAVRRRMGVGRSQAARIYYLAGMEPPAVIPKAKPAQTTAKPGPKPMKPAAWQGEAVIPSGVSVQVLPGYTGERWAVSPPAVSNINPQECRPWAKYR
jgi:biotin operon repressor